MDSYLEIAAQVLRVNRRPMSPRAILAEAYRIELVPPNLYGRTQHKTLQARISEDIIQKKGRSAFFRTGPGKFFLTEFLNDETIPKNYRQPFVARRRYRELIRGPVLAIKADVLNNHIREGEAVDPCKILEILRNQKEPYLNAKDSDDGLIFIRSFVCVIRDSQILTYRLGRYRDDRDAFTHKRSVGFSTLVHADEQTLFAPYDLGITESGIRATQIDLDLPITPSPSFSSIEMNYFKFLLATQPSGTNDLLAVITFKCPEWFEPLRKRLALNDLMWIDVNVQVNNIEDFDPWSRTVLESHYGSRDVLYNVGHYGHGYAAR